MFMICCESRYGDAAGVAEELYGEVKETLVLDPYDNFGVLGFVCNCLSQGLDFSVCIYKDNDIPEGVE